MRTKPQSKKIHPVGPTTVTASLLTKHPLHLAIIQEVHIIQAAKYV